jgi:hypothetical protein
LGLSASLRIRITGASGSVRSRRKLSRNSWLLRLIAWDGILPVLVWLAPMVAALLLPGNQDARLTVATSIPLASFVIRLFVGLRQVDSSVFDRNFGCQFNLTITGEELCRVALNDPDCRGVLVNSALSEISMAISRDTIVSLIRPGPSQPQTNQPKKPWWKIW